jgi:hypothetical protein
MKNVKGIERRIARALVADFLARSPSHSISVYDGEETTVTKSQSAQTVLRALATTDQDQLRLYDGTACLGFVLLIWGNDADLISDCSESLSNHPSMSEADKAAQWGDQ